MDFSKYNQAIAILEQTRQRSLGAIPLLNQARSTPEDGVPERSFDFIAGYINHHHEHCLGAILRETTICHVLIWSTRMSHWCVIPVSPIIPKRLRRKHSDPHLVSLIADAENRVIVSNEVIPDQAIHIDSDDEAAVETLHLKAFSNSGDAYKWTQHLPAHLSIYAINDAIIIPDNICEWM